jgi:GNAT superfamily N-acetyltransferase
MNSVTIRRAGIADIDAVTPLFDAYRQFYEQPSDQPAARRFLTDRVTRGECVIFLAEYNERAVGFTLLYPTFTYTQLARLYVLNDLFVDPGARKHGVGTKLLDAAAEFARAEGAVRLTLRTAATNRTAQSVYEQNGWKRDDQFFVYHRAL